MDSRGRENHIRTDRSGAGHAAAEIPGADEREHAEREGPRTGRRPRAGIHGSTDTEIYSTPSSHGTVAMTDETERGRGRPVAPGSDGAAE
ncbi:hypothetical protein BRC90_08020 [Halobacteriales archaeon QS_4_69_34]|nr:MAG: hypothetical protein BRC90_08020 [Halobacteriales archaeon QS_4_69_34]